MGFSSVKLYQFRNLTDTEVFLLEKDIYLVGENGQGKTNFLEALYLLSIGSSFRVKNENVLVKYGCSDMSVKGIYNKDGYSSEIQLKIQQGKKTIHVDNKRLTDRKQLLRDFPCIAFTHDDINYVNGPPSARRQFINQTISLYDFSYIDALRTYNRIIKLRNRILKERKPALLDIYDKQAAEAGYEILTKRNRLIKEFNYGFNRLYQKVSDSDINLEIKYVPSWKIDEQSTVDDIISLIRENRNRDLMYGTSTSGPHRDRIGFYNNKNNYAATASTGQIRLISLVLRAAQASFVTSIIKKKPLLLLDDVLLEMDLNKRRRFLDYLPDYNQAFFTFLPDEGLIRMENNGAVYRVVEGMITREN